MKVSGRVIQNKNISHNTERLFCAGYKGHNITISADHGHGKPKYDHLTRYDITVTDERGCYAVNDWQDCHTMQDAIRYALDGAQL